MGSCVFSNYTVKILISITWIFQVVSCAWIPLTLEYQNLPEDPNINGISEERSHFRYSYRSLGANIHEYHANQKNNLKISEIPIDYETSPKIEDNGETQFKAFNEALVAATHFDESKLDDGLLGHSNLKTYIWGQNHESDQGQEYSVAKNDFSSNGYSLRKLQEIYEHHDFYENPYIAYLDEKFN